MLLMKTIIKYLMILKGILLADYGILVILGFLTAASPLKTVVVQDGKSLHYQANSKHQWTGSVEQKVWGLMTIWSEAKFNFPYFDRIPELDWDKKVQDYIPRVISVKNIEEYYDVLIIESYP